jgi:indole-3-glycerol phosphate synthase
MILDDILAAKAQEIEVLKQVQPVGQLGRAAMAQPRPRGFLKALRGESPEFGLAGPGGIRVIAEVKKASPSRGVIRADFDPVAIAAGYEAAGATCLSCLTEGPFFQGSLLHLQAIRQQVKLPVLRKDFIIDEYQVIEARAAGADCILLIVAAFHGESAGERTPDDMIRLKRAAESLGMDVLVEVHTEEELTVALDADSPMIGINNRDLKTFKTSLDVTYRLAPLVPKGRLLVSESGIATEADLAALAEAGARAVLVGESLMKSPDVAAALRQLLGLPEEE